MSPPRPIAVVLVSGGMDSCVAAACARDEGFAAAFLHGNYGQRTEARELASFHAIADRFGVPARLRLVADMRYLGTIGGSSLTDPSIAVERSPLVAAAAPSRMEHGERGEHGAKREHGVEKETGERSLGVGRSVVPSSYVPFRNAHFLAAAVSWGEVLGAEAIYIGAVEEDSSGYPDCRLAYYQAFDAVIDLGTKPETRMTIQVPLIHLDKAAIVRRGLDLGAPFELTWSCYSESDLACGECDSCALRLRGFERAGAVDPIAYRRSR